MEELYIADVAEVTFEDKKTGDVAFVGNGQVTGLTGSEEEEKIFGGIGNKHIYSIRHSKELELNITNATFDLEYMAMTQGSDIKNRTTTVVAYEKGLEVDDGSIELKEKDYDGEVKIRIGRKTVKAEAESGVVEVPSDLEIEDGEEVDVAYHKEIEGETVILDATKFSRNYKVTYRTIIYSVDTNEVVADLYFVFPNASPSGEYELELENGEAYTPELTFSAMAEKNADELGRIIQVPREEETEEDTP